MSEALSNIKRTEIPFQTMQTTGPFGDGYQFDQLLFSHHLQRHTEQPHNSVFFLLFFSVRCCSDTPGDTEMSAGEDGNTISSVILEKDQQHLRAMTIGNSGRRFTLSEGQKKQICLFT